MEKNICCLCGKEYVGWGNNAYPLDEGRCCDSCNNKVILARLQRMHELDKEREDDDQTL